MYKLAICDDDVKLCNKLEEEIRSYEKSHNKLFEIEIYYDGEGILRRLYNHEHFDFIILDICLKDTTGIDVGKKIRAFYETFDIPIIYISTFKDYALQLFKIRPFNFLIKPIHTNELYAVLDELCQRLDTQKQFFTYKNCNQYSRIPYDKIMYFYSKDKKVYITTVDKTTEEFWGKPRDVETQTNGYFLSIHKSFLINCNFVEKYTYDNVQMADGRLLSISPVKRKPVRDTILQMMQHDLKHHINIIAALIKEKQFQDVNLYIKRMETALEETAYRRYSANHVIDSILNYMLSDAQTDFKNLSIDIQLPSELGIDYFDISIILGNLLANAVHASLNSKEKYLRLQMKLEKGILFISVENSFDHELRIQNGNYISTKTACGSEKHGIGLSNVKNVTEKYNGKVTISHKNHIFTVNVILYTEII